MLVTFEDGAENSVNAVSLFLTPTGTETLDQRRQVAVQAAGEGRDFALFDQTLRRLVLPAGGDDGLPLSLNEHGPGVGHPGHLGVGGAPLHLRRRERAGTSPSSPGTSRRT